MNQKETKSQHSTPTVEHFSNLRVGQLSFQCVTIESNAQRFHSNFNILKEQMLRFRCPCFHGPLSKRGNHHTRQLVDYMQGCAVLCTSITFTLAPIEYMNEFCWTVFRSIHKRKDIVVYRIKIFTHKTHTDTHNHTLQKNEL